MLEGFFAHVVLDAAGVHLSGLLVHTQMDQKLGKGFVALINRFGQVTPLWRELYLASLVDVDQVLFRELFYSDVHSWALKIQCPSDVYLAHGRVFTLE